MIAFVNTPVLFFSKVMKQHQFIHRRQFLGTSFLFAGSMATGFSATGKNIPNTRLMPWTPGKFRMRLRTCKKPVPKGIAYEPVSEEVEWNASETAIIICDMWSDHPCKMAAQRVGDMAPRMNSVLSAARDHGVLIVHAPSGGIDLYEDTPFRARMKEAANVKPPVPIKGNWECELDRETELPVEANRRVENATHGCDDPVPAPHPDFDRHEHPAIGIIGWDGVSQSGQEMWNVFQREGIRNVVLMGVHTNMCVLGRPFGIRQMVKLGFNVALCRDLTDALYDPRDPPYVSHTRGVELIVEHIEKYWCPSFLGANLTTVISGSDNPSKKVASP